MGARWPLRATTSDSGIARRKQTTSSHCVKAARITSRISEGIVTAATLGARQPNNEGEESKMAKKTREQPPVAAELAPQRRDSFLPEDPEPPGPVTVKAAAPEIPGLNIASDLVTLTIERTDTRNVRLTLRIDPLRPCVQNRLLPVQPVTGEMLACFIGEMLARAGSEAATDGMNQHYRKEQEESEAKERFEKRQ